MVEPAPLQLSKRRIAGAAASWLLLGPAMLIPALSASRSVAQARPSQYDVEGAYLLDFGRFIEITAGPRTLQRATFDICILGRDPIGPAIDKLAAGDTIDHRTVRIVRDINASQARSCAIAFITTHDHDEIRRELNVLSGADVLTVGDSPDFLTHGGMIQFAMEEGRVRFAVNLDAVRKSHLVLSSGLLRVALYVKGQPQLEAAP